MAFSSGKLGVHHGQKAGSGLLQGRQLLPRVLEQLALLPDPRQVPPQLVRVGDLRDRASAHHLRRAGGSHPGQEQCLDARGVRLDRRFEQDEPCVVDGAGQLDHLGGPAAPGEDHPPGAVGLGFHVELGAQSVRQWCQQLRLRRQQAAVRGGLDEQLAVLLVGVEVVEDDPRHDEPLFQPVTLGDEALALVSVPGDFEAAHCHHEAQEPGDRQQDERHNDCEAHLRRPSHRGSFSVW
ncbi:MAG: hypothetical protein QM765_13495 [Myxococcales bacterium]